MEGVRGAHAPCGHPCRGQRGLERADGLLATGDHAATRIVDGRDVDIAGQVLGDGVDAERHGHHDTAGRGVHEPRAHRDHLDRGVEVEHPGQRGRRIFADAVPGHDRRCHAVRLDQLGQRVFDGEQRGLGAVGVFEVAPDAVEDLGPQVVTHLVAERRGALVEVPGEQRFALVQSAGHRDVLGPLSGEQERDTLSDVGGLVQVGDRVADEHVVGLGRRQHRRRILLVVHHGGQPDRLPAPPGERVGRVGQAHRVLAGQIGRQVGTRLCQRLLAARRQQQNLRAGRCGRRRAGGGLFQHDVGVGAADPERADPGAAYPVGLPGPVRAAHAEGSAVDVQFGVGAVVVQRGRDLAVFQAQDRLDQARDARRGLEVPDVGLDRAEIAGRATGLLGQVERLAKALDLDRVAQRGAGAVGLDVGDARRVDAGDGVRLGDDLGLPERVGRGVGHLGGTVVVQRRPADHRVDVVPVVEGVFERLEDHHADAAAEDGAVGAHVERAAVSGGGNHRALLVPVAHPVRDADRRAARQCDVTFAVEDRLARQVHRDQRRRARRRHRQGRAAEVELVGHPGGEMVLVVGQRQGDHVEAGALPDDHRRVVVGHQVVQQVPAGRAGSEDPDGRLEIGRVVAGVLERVEHRLQEQPVLRVQRPRGVGREAEEFGVEVLDPGHQRGPAHVGVVGQRPLGHARGQQLLLGQIDDRFDPVAQVAPERRHRVRAREPPRHADDGDGILGDVPGPRISGTAGHDRGPTFRRDAAR